MRDMSSTNDVVTALSRLYETAGYLTASAVVEAARDPSSPLHGEFEWDDSEAAVRYRLYQARTLIRRVRLLYVGGQSQTVHHVPIKCAEGNEGKYLVVSDLVKDEDAQARALDAASRYLDGAIRRLQELRRDLGQGNVQRFDAAIRAVEAAKLALVA